MFEYEFQNKKFTQEDVDKRAADKGLSTEQYLTNNPAIKKIDLGNQNAPQVTDATVEQNTTASDGDETSLVTPEVTLPETEILDFNEITVEQLREDVTWSKREKRTLKNVRNFFSGLINKNKDDRKYLEFERSFADFATGKSIYIRSNQILNSEFMFSSPSFTDLLFNSEIAEFKEEDGVIKIDLPKANASDEEWQKVADTINEVMKTHLDGVKSGMYLTEQQGEDRKQKAKQISAELEYERRNMNIKQALEVTLEGEEKDYLENQLRLNEENKDKVIDSIINKEDKGVVDDYYYAKDVLGPTKIQDFRRKEDLYNKEFDELIGEYKIDPEATRQGIANRYDEKDRQRYVDDKMKEYITRYSINDQDLIQVIRASERGAVELTKETNITGLTIGMDYKASGEKLDLEFLGDTDRIELLRGINNLSEVQQLAMGDFTPQMKEAQLDKALIPLLSKAREQLYKEFEDASTEANDLAQAKKDIDIDKANLQAASDAINSEFDTLSSQIDAVQQALNGDLSKLKNLENTLTQMRGNPSRYSESQYQSVLNDFENTLNEYDAKTKELNSFQAQYDDIVNRNNDLEARNQELNSKISKFNEDQELYKQELGKLDEKDAALVAAYGFKISDNTIMDAGNRFTITDEYQEWKNKNVSGTNEDGTPFNSGFFGSARDLGNRLIQGVGVEIMDLYVGTGVLVFTELGSFIKGATGLGPYSDSDRVYDTFDQLNALYKNHVSDASFLAVADDLEGNAFDSYKHSMQTLGNMLPFTLALINSMKKGNFVKTQSMYKSMKTAGFNQRKLQVFKTTEIGFRLTAIDQYQEGKELGLSDDQARGYATFTGLAIGMSNAVFAGEFGIGTGVRREALREVFKIFSGNLRTAATKKAINKVIVNEIKNFSREFGEEEIELLLSDVAKHSFGLSHAAEFTNFETHRQIFEATVLLSGSIRGFSGASVKEFKMLKNNFYNGFRARASEVIGDINFEIGAIDEKIQAQQNPMYVGPKSGEMLNKLKNELVQARDYAMLIQNAINISPESVTNEQLDLIVQKQALVEQKKMFDSSYHAKIDQEIDAINTQIQNSDVISITRKNFDRTVDNTQKIIEDLNPTLGDRKINFKSFDGESSTQDMYNFLVGETGLDLETAQETIGTHGGAFVANGVEYIVINKPVSLSSTGANVAAHELLHKMMFMTLAERDGKGNILKDSNGDPVINKEASMALAKGLGTYLMGIDATQVTNSIFSQRLMAYQKAPASVQAQEVLTLFSDALATGDIKFEENNFQKVGEFLEKAYTAIGLPINFGEAKKPGVQFKTGKDIYNFLKGFNESVKKGSLTEDQKAMFIGGATFEGEIADLTLDKNIIDEATAERETENRSFTVQFSQDASNKVQSIYETEGEAGAFDIIEEFKPITKRIARRYSQVPGYDEQLIIDEIETGQRGIIDLIRDYNIESGVPLAAYINKYLPARSIEAANRILKTEFEDDVTEARGVVAEESVEQRETRKTSLIVVAEKLGIENDVANEVKNANLDLTQITNFKQVPNVVSNTIGDLLGISPAKILNKANLTAAEVRSAQQFFLKNPRLLIDALPEGFDSEGQATGVPRTILAAMYNQRQTRAKTKAGLKFHVKRNNIKDSEFLSLVDIVDGKVTRTRNTSARIIAAADLLGKVITNQELRKQNPNLQSIKSGMSDILFSNDIDFNYNTFNSVRTNSGVVIPLLPYQLDKDFVDSKTRTGMRDMDAQYAPGITFDQQASLVADQFVLKNPEFRHMLQTTMTGGIRGGLFLTKAEFNNKVKGSNTVEYKRNYYNKNKRLTKNAVESFQDINANNDRNQRLNHLYDFAKAVESHLNQNPQDQWFFEAFARDGSRGQSAAVRILGPFRGYAIDKNGNPVYNKEVVEEHSMPQNNVGYALLNAAIDGNVDQVFPAIKATYMQLSLLKTDDTIIRKAGLEASMPSVYYNKILPRLVSGDLVVPDGLAAAARLAAPGTEYASKLGSEAINLNNYFIPEINMTIAQYYGVDGITDIAHANTLVMQQLTGETKPIVTFNHSKDIAINNARIITPNTPSKGGSVFDFDETLIIDGENFIIAKKGNQEIKISSADWPILGPEYTAQGYTFDFTDFVNVRGGVDGPLLQKMKNQIKKYGNQNVFVLTARPAESARAINEWLKTKGINVPFKNITGLGDSRGEAKGEWFVNKYAEGYNDMYFVDDALPNVKAVQNVFNQLDMKGKSVQAKIQFSRDIDSEFNQMLERTKGVGEFKTFSRVEAQKRGKNKGKFTLFVPPSAEDFTGLLRYFAGTGAQGDADIKFFEESLVKPFARADREMSQMKETIRSEYKGLRKKYPQVSKKLGKLVGESGFTFDNAIRVYLFNKAGHDIPGLSKAGKADLIRLVKSDKDLLAFANALSAVSKQQSGYVEPDENWNVGNIAEDLQNVVNKVSRKQFLAEWKGNVDVIFSEKNLNKIEAVYGSDFRSALQDILYRMESGQNRRRGATKFENQWNNWVNNSVGAIMFFNARSAVLQTLSTVNFINFEDNNIFKAGRAFANQKQYWSDFSMLFNSDFLRNRRAGLATNVNEAELASAVAGAKNKAKAALNYLLKIGFTPTQIADSFAIASGGATFYRNRVGRYLKEGMSQAEAESQAMLDFREIAEETQQSARPDRISQQQASNLGRIILAFANTPMQYNRLIKKAAGDLINKRGDWRANVSRILYYGAVQNFIFASLQNALFAMAFEDDEEKEELKETRVVNSMLDSLLRGSGIAGASLATIKNAILEYAEQSEKGYRADYNEVVIEALQVSPPLGSKARKLSSAGKTVKYNKEVMDRMDTFDYDNPLWLAVGNTVEATTNIPMARAIRKIDNLREAMNQDNTNLQRLFLSLGWSSWDLNVGEEVIRNEGKDNEYKVFLDKRRKAVEDVKTEIKEEKKQETIRKKEEKKIQKEKEQQAEVEANKEKQKEEGDNATCAAISSKGKRCKRKPVKGGFCTVHEKVEKSESGEMKQCKKIKSDGKRCGMTTNSKSGLCYYHD